MMTKQVFILLLAVSLAACGGQCKEAGAEHVFTIDTVHACTPPLSQGRTSTCWAFATASLLESELLRLTGDTVRLSPMYVVRQKYLNQFEAYYYACGGENIRAGSLPHSFLRVWREDGLMPRSAYIGAGKGVKQYDHRRLLRRLKLLAQQAVNHRDLPRYRRQAIELLDREMGAVPRTFTYRGREYTPRSFADSLRLCADNYVLLTSFSHHPFYTSFVLEVPDNWEHGTFFNVPLDTLERAVRQALQEGYTVAWDGDVSEASYDAGQGVALWPHHPVTQETRQQEFEQYTTTDDHMMHIVGTAHDESGRFYYLLKNSYGCYGRHKGMLYMSENYFRAKTVSIMLHREALAGFSLPIKNAGR